MNSASLLLLLVATTAAPAGPETSPKAEVAACRSEQVAQCNATYKQASDQCTRYYLRETEAFSICHESSLKRQEICIGRAEAGCATPQPKGSPEDAQAAD